MRKWAMRGLLAAALGAALVLSVQAADDSDKPAAPTGVSAWWNGLFGPKETADKTKKKIEPDEKSPEVSMAEREAMRRRERDAVGRRIAVCDRLKEMAQLKNDLELERQVGELEDTITKLYLERLATLDQLDDEQPLPKEKTKKSGASASSGKKSNGEGDQ